MTRDVKIARLVLADGTIFEGEMSVEYLMEIILLVLMNVVLLMEMDLINMKIVMVTA